MWIFRICDCIKSLLISVFKKEKIIKNFTYIFSKKEVVLGSELAESLQRALEFMYSFFVIFKFPLKYHSRQKNLWVIQGCDQTSYDHNRQIVLVYQISYDRSHLTVAC